MITVLRRIVTLRNLLLLLLLVAILLAMWLLGPLLVLGGEQPLAQVGARLTLGALVIVVVALILGANSIRLAGIRQRQRADLARAERLSLRERAAIIEVDSDLRESFMRAVARIDGLVFGEGRAAMRGSRLPWYLVMGAPRSGKSALLRQSGLDFAVMPEATDPAPGAVRPPDPLSWWVAEGGVLLDAAGGYLAPPGTRDHLPGWTALLALIKEHRPRRPLHGGILVISLHDLVTASAEDRKVMATTLRARLQEMFASLGSRFPIYLVATKADSLSGFAESVISLPEPERIAAWGGLFPAVLDFHDLHAARAIDEALASLLDATALARNDRLRGEHDVSRRQRIFGFPDQLGYLLPQLADLIQSVFRSSRFEVKPMLRGLFITSARQAPQALDIATARLVAPMNLTVPTVVAAQSGETPYFIQSIFTRFIFPESGLAGFDPRLQRKRSSRSILGIVVALLLLGIGATAATSNADIAEQRLDQVHGDLVTLLAQRAALTPDSSWPAQLQILDLSQQISSEYRGWIGSVIGTLAGAVQGKRYNDVNAAASKVYARTLKEIFLPRIIFDMEGDMNATLAGADSPRLLRTLTVYLMLNDPAHFQADTIRQWVNADWRQNFLLSPDAQARLNGHLTNLLADLPRNIPLDQSLIAAARQALVQLPTAASLYAQLQARAAQDPSLPPFQRGGALGAAAPLSLAAPGVGGLNTQIPGLYTRQGFETYILRRLPETATALSRDNWVLGPSPISGSGDASNLLDQVAALYSTDYIRYWDSAIRGLQLRQAPDLTTAIDALGSLSGPDSPLARLVSAVAANTNLGPPPQASPANKLVQLAAGQGVTVPNAATAISGPAAAAAANLLPQSSGFTTWPGAPIQAHFAPIIALAGASAAQAAGDPTVSPLDQVRSLIAGAYSLLQGVAAAPNPQFAALNLLKSQSNGSVGDALSPLLTQAPAYPPVAGTLIRQVAESTSAILADLAGQYISMSWRQAGGTTCEGRIAGRYPFNPRASAEVALADFQSFFGPGGIMDSFYTTMIQPLGLTTGGAAGSTAALLVDPRTLGSFQQAIRIRDAFFRNGQLSVPFGITPVHLDPAALNDMLTIGGQQFLYQHEPPRRWDIVWPTTSGDPTVTFTITDLKGNPYTLSYVGDWALFRFVAGAVANSFGSLSRYTIGLSVSGLTASYELNTDSLQSAFDPTTVAGFNCPQFD